MIRSLSRLLDFQTLVNDEPSLKQRLYDTTENLTEPVLGSKMNRDEFKKDSHDERFEIDILMKVIRQFMKCLGAKTLFFLPSPR